VNKFTFFKEKCMAEILIVEVGDKFWSAQTDDLLKVTRIWFAYNHVDDRWETSVEWLVVPRSGDRYQLNAKAREFVMKLRDGGYGRTDRIDDEISFNPSITTAQVTSGPLAGAPLPKTPTVDPKIKRWEDHFCRNATRYGLQPTDLGRKFWLDQSRQFTIIGSRAGRRKLFIMIKGKRSGIYRISPEEVRSKLV
jgi:hypothetical protein